MKTIKLSYIQGLETYLTKRGIEFTRDLEAGTIEFDFKDNDQAYFLLITEFGRFYERMDAFNTI